MKLPVDYDVFKLVRMLHYPLGLTLILSSLEALKKEKKLLENNSTASSTHTQTQTHVHIPKGGCFWRAQEVICQRNPSLPPEGLHTK